MTKKTVTIFQYRLFHYRETLFECLRNLCGEVGIELHVVAGQPFGAEKAKRDEGHLPWVRRVENVYVPITEKKDLCWQPIPKHLSRSDLMVVMHENRLLANYWLMAKRRVGGPKVAFWGHGRDFQSRAPGGIRERWKAWTIGQVDWWFAYTPLTVEILEGVNYPRERTTCLNNAIDTRTFGEDVSRVTSDEMAELREALGWGNMEGPIALFCGSLYPDKKIDLLLYAADRIRKVWPAFGLVVVGDGSSAEMVKAAARNRPWLVHVGAKRGLEKARYFKLCDLILNPGSVGLHILDAFAAGRALITTRGARHGPEIAYLESGRNGLITGDSLEEYVDGTLELLSNRERLRSVNAGASADAETYTVERMAEKFVQGIVGCLEAPKKGSVLW